MGAYSGEQQVRRANPSASEEEIQQVLQQSLWATKDRRPTGIRCQVSMAAMEVVVVEIRVATAVIQGVVALLVMVGWVKNE